MTTAAGIPVAVLVQAAAAALIVISLPLLYRVYTGPTLQDRVIAINVAGTSTIVVLALVGVALEVPGVLDIGLVYAVLNFTMSIAVARFVDAELI